MQKKKKKTRQPIPLVSVFVAVAAIVGFVGYKSGWRFDYRHYGILLILFFILTLVDRQKEKRRLAEALLKGDFEYAIMIYEREMPRLSKKKPQVVENMKMNMAICHLNMGEVKEAEALLMEVEIENMEAPQKALRDVYLAQTFLLQDKQPARAMKLLKDAKGAFYLKGSESIMAFASASMNQFEEAKKWVEQAKGNAESDKIGSFKGYLSPDYRLERMLYQFYIGATHHRMQEEAIRDEWWEKLKNPAYENVFTDTAEQWIAEQ